MERETLERLGWLALKNSCIKEYIKTNRTEVRSSLPHKSNRRVTEIKDVIFKTDQKEMLSLTTE